MLDMKERVIDFRNAFRSFSVAVFVFWKFRQLCTLQLAVLCVCREAAHSSNEGSERSSLVASALATFFKQVPGYVSAKSSSGLDKWSTFVAKDKKTVFSKLNKPKVKTALINSHYCT